MIRRAKKSGFTLTELIVTMSIVAVLAGIGLPAANQLQKSFESSSRLRDVVAAALSNARSTALARNKYVGLRFQRDADGDQYMVFIVEDIDVGPGLNLQGNMGFRALAGKKPIRLPKMGSVMDLRVKTDYSIYDAFDTDETVVVYSAPGVVDDAASNDRIDEDRELLDSETFSVIFSPAGKLVLRVLRVAHSNTAGGDVFNTSASGLGKFVEDEYFDTGLGSYPVEGLQIESSRNNFVIVDKKEFDGVPTGKRWTDCLQHQKAFYINPYTGELIDPN